MDDSMPGIGSPLLENFIDGVVDYKGRPVMRSKSGYWRSAYHIIGVEVAERFAYSSISSNLITYLTGPLGQSTAKAAMNVNMWSGTASLLPLVGAFIADAFIGQYLTIIIASVLYILALALLALSTLLVGSSLLSPELQVVMFYVSLYLVAFAQGGHKPCVQAFGADQFDADHPEESKAKSSFFNWWFFGLCAGPTVGIFVISYIQDNLSWGLGFGIPCIIMGLALIIFLLGTMTYRFGEKAEKKRSFFRFGHVFFKAIQNCKMTPSAISITEEEAGGISSNKFGFLNKALNTSDGSNEDINACRINELEEVKAFLRLVPIWVSCLGYGIVFAQTSTLFTKQGATMDRSIGSSFEIPAATLQSFITLFILVLIPIYDTLLVPLTSVFTRTPSGITMLQRIGFGIFTSIVSMLVAAVIETKRLKTALDYGLVDDPEAMVPMKIWWLLPQCILAAAGDVFTLVGMQEFFYDQMPSDLKSTGLALYLSIFGIGSFLSSFIISVIQKATSANGHDGWISDNMNCGHIDFFYYLLAGISTGALLIYIYAAKSYVYNRGRTFGQKE